MCSISFATLHQCPLTLQSSVYDWQLRSIDRLLEKLRASVEQADKPFGSSVHTRNLRDRISDLIRERQDICFEAHQH